MFQYQNTSAKAEGEWFAFPAELQPHPSISELNLVALPTNDGWMPYPNPTFAGTTGWEILNLEPAMPRVARVVSSDSDSSASLHLTKDVEAPIHEPIDADKGKR
jgi:hypothetical protein